MSDSDTTPTLPEVIRTQIDRVLIGMHTCMPGRVVGYSAATQRASVQPLLKRERRTANGTRITDALPVIDSVPVAFPGSGPYSITFPVAVGDTVLLVFSESSLATWLVNDGIVDPADPRRFALTDAIAIPGLRSFRNPVSPAPASNKVKIGTHSAADPVARKSDIDALYTVIHDAIRDAVPVSDSTGAGLQASIKTLLEASTLPPGSATVVVD